MSSHDLPRTSNFSVLYRCYNHSDPEVIQFLDSGKVAAEVVTSFLNLHKILIYSPSTEGERERDTGNDSKTKNPG